MMFHALEKGSRQANPRPNTFLLFPDNWDDYSYKTTFKLVWIDSEEISFEIGTVKIGFIGQNKGWTRDAMATDFSALRPGWFSLGQDVEYYKNIRERLPETARTVLLDSLSDIVSNEILQKTIQNEDVFRLSLMRGVSFSVIHGQFKRVLSGDVILTDYHFQYRDNGDEKRAPIDLKFKVTPASKPPTNLHVLIGRNGVGKTTLLNNMVGAILAPSASPIAETGQFLIKGTWDWQPLPEDYFSSVVSVSFSAFDPFVRVVDQLDRSSGIAYFYVGMRKAAGGAPKSDMDLADDFLKSLDACLSQPEKASRWLQAIKRLESDDNFADMDLGRMAHVEHGAALQIASSLIGRMSSGHAIVLLTITKLVETVEEKTLVLMDEPESHLHPPLLSAFVRALSELLHNRNAVAIIATHSPVVVQEVPKVCVWKLTRLRNKGRSDRPERETFGENVGVLTREIFGLEVSKSGFHSMLQSAVNEGGTFDEIMDEYEGQLGFEAQAILTTLIRSRDVKSGTQK